MKRAGPSSPNVSPNPPCPGSSCRCGPTGSAVSFFGDLHPSYSGNVVKAIASAKQGQAVVSRVLHKRAPPARRLPTASSGNLNEQLRATVHEVNRLTPNIVEVVVKAPARRPRLSARPVLPAAELRDARAPRRRHDAGHGGPGTDRRIGRPGSRACSRPSCSKWAGPPTCARCSSPASLSS